MNKGEYKKLIKEDYTDDQLLYGQHEKKFMVKNKEYTENQLIEMIEYYELHHYITIIYYKHNKKVGFIFISWFD